MATAAILKYGGWTQDINNKCVSLILMQKKKEDKNNTFIQRQSSAIIESIVTHAHVFLCS